MTKFGELTTAAEFIELVKRICRGVIRAEVPQTEYATVVTMDRTGRQAQVQQRPGTAPFTVGMTGVQPADVGQVVLLDGKRGDRYIAQVMGPISALTGEGSETYVTPSSMIIAGHSYTDLYIGTSVESSLFYRLTSLFRIAPEDTISLGRSGSQIISADTLGSWSTVMHGVYPTAYDGYTSAMSDFNFLCTGINDAILGDSDGILGAFRETIKAVIGRFRSSAIFDNTDSSVVLSGFISGNFAGASGSTHAVSFGLPASITITVPSDFVGGNINLGFLTSDAGGVADVTVDGVPQGSFDTAQGAAFINAAYIHQIKGLSAGTHTIVATFTSITNFVSFDYWAIEAPIPPIVAVCNVARCPVYGGFWGGITDAKVAKFNVQIAAAVQSFDANVLEIDMDGVLGKDTDNFITGSVHPNDRGLGLVAAEVYNRVMSSGLNIAERTVFNRSGNQRSPIDDLSSWENYK